MLRMRDHFGSFTKGTLKSIWILFVFMFLVATISLANTILAESAKTERLVAGLNGEQVIPPVKINTTGEVFFLPKNGNLAFTLNVTGISNLTKVEIQMANTSMNGPTVVDLLTHSVSRNQTGGGVLLKGNITSSELVGPLTAKPITDLQGSMEKGNTYVIISTAKYPNGEIRGQVGSEGIDESGTSLGQNNVTESADLLNEPE